MVIQSQRVVARFLKRAYGERKKFLGKDVRLRWNDRGWLLEELPQKGKKKLKKATLENICTRYGGQPNFDAYIPGNILRRADLSSSDNYDTIKRKILEAYEVAAVESLDKMSPEQVEKGRGWTFLKDEKWYENEVFYLNVVPEGIEPFVVEGKDFKVQVTWTSFESYSPNSDFQQMDPHYTMYESSSATAARKFYMMLKADPSALKSVTWNEFDNWMKNNKIGYEIHFSQWH